MPWGNKQPDLKNDPTYLEPRVTAVESSLASNTKHQTNWTNIKQAPYNAKTDGTNVVSIINQVISDVNSAGGGVVFLPDGTYSVGFSNSTTMVKMLSNVELRLANNAIIKALPNSNTSYSVINCTDISNFKIIGGTIQGERQSHTDSASGKVWKQWSASTPYNVGDVMYTGETGYKCTVAGTSGSATPVLPGGATVGTTTVTDGTVTWQYYTATTGEWGMGINIYGCTDFLIDKTIVRDCWGDGIYLANSTNNSSCTNGKLIDVTCDNDRRNGISLISGKNIKIVRPVLKNINGTAPQAGLDIEPNSSANILTGIVIDSPYTENNIGQGIVANFNLLSGSTNAIDISIINPTDKGSLIGLELSQLKTATAGKVKVIEPYLENSQQNGLRVRNWSSSGATIDVISPTIINPNRSAQTASTYGAGLLIYRESNDTTGDTFIGNVSIYNPTVKDISTPNLMTCGIVVRDFYRADYFTKNVCIIDPFEVSGYGVGGNARMWYTCQSGGFISDKRRVLEYDFASATSLTLGLLTPHSVIHNATSTANATITMGSNLPLSWRFTVELRSAHQITITPPSTDTIYPIGNLGKGIYASAIGSKVTIRKTDTNSWIIEEMVGTWTALT